MATSSAALPKNAAKRMGRRRWRVRPRWLVVAGVLLAVLLAAGWFFGRDSSLVRVEKVDVSGAYGSGGSEVEQTIAATARSMTTLDFDTARLRSALAAYPVVAWIEVRTHFPHGVSVVVHRRTPVATIAFGGKDVPVAADGTLLTGTAAKGLPALTARRAPAAGRVAGTDALAQVRVLAGATAAQLAQITHVGVGADGVEVSLKDAPRIIFGDGDHAADQWVALKRVLADPASQGAGYIDVSVAERPAAGGFADAASTDTGSVDGSTDGSTDGSYTTTDGTGDTTQ